MFYTTVDSIGICQTPRGIYDKELPLFFGIMFSSKENFYQRTPIFGINDNIFYTNIKEAYYGYLDQYPLTAYNLKVFESISSLYEILVDTSTAKEKIIDLINEQIGLFEKGELFEVPASNFIKNFNDKEIIPFEEVEQMIIEKFGEYKIFKNRRMPIINKINALLNGKAPDRATLSEEDASLFKGLFVETLKGKEVKLESLSKCIACNQILLSKLQAA